MFNAFKNNLKKEAFDLEGLAELVPCSLEAIDNLD